jgi:hypothetical protein
MFCSRGHGEKYATTAQLSLHNRALVYGDLICIPLQLRSPLCFPQIFPKDASLWKNRTTYTLVVCDAKALARCISKILG